MQRSKSDIDFLTWQLANDSECPAHQFEAQLESCRNEVQRMPDAAFQTLLEQWRDKVRMECEAREERQEQERFFNLPDAKADFSHWSKAVYWILEEAVALAFGRDPKEVNWASVEEFVDLSPFAVRYARLRDLIERAKTASQLSDPVLPVHFIHWVKKNAIDFPPDLEDALRAQGHQVAQWQSLEEIKQQLDIEREAHHACNLQLIRAKQELQHLSQQNSKLQTERMSKLHTKERETALKLILVMAKKKYGYIVGRRNNASTAIAGHVRDLGLEIDEDTVRNWLGEAAEELTGSTSVD